jgi:hypothetical protein
VEHAEPHYVLSGLRLAYDPAALIQDLLESIPRGGKAQIQRDDSLWKWHQRRTNEWLGSDFDRRFL